MEGTFRVMVWVRNLAWLQLLFTCFTLLGFGILGFFPSLMANFQIVKRRFNSDFDPPNLKEYWQYYKKEWWKGNLFGICIAIVTYVLMVDFKYFSSYSGSANALTMVILWVLSYVFLGMVIFLFPTYIHFKYKWLKCFKFSFLYSLSHPFITFILILATLVLSELMKAFPASVLLFSSSLISILWFWGTLSVYRRLELEVK